MKKRVYKYIYFFLTFVFLMTGCKGENVSELYGLWAIDSVTKYELNPDGTGALILPDEKYEFRYSAGSGKLEIDFLDETLTDSEYKYDIESETLTLISGKDKYSIEYTLYKETDQ